MKNLHSALPAIFAAIAFAAIAPGATSSRPNIVFILVDDLGYADVGFNGSTWYETPHLDALARESLVLDRSYMYPTCSPSRTAYFTGKQSFRTGVYTVPVLEVGTDQENIFSRWTVGREHPIFMEVLARAGYKGIHSGKWHIVGPYPTEELKMTFPLKEKLSQPDPWDFSWFVHHRTPEVMQYYPEGRGFVKNVGGTYRGDPALEVGGYKSKTGGYFAPFSNPFIEPKPTDEWLTDRLTDEVLEFMAANRASPFFINLNFYAVHNPIRARSREAYARYLAKPGDPVTGQGLGPRRDEMAKYATMIESVDRNVQRVIDFLDANGLREKTVVIVTSDNGQNGGQSSNHQLRGSKGYIYEGGIRVPTLINCPGRVRPRRSDTPALVTDYFPTFLDLAGITNYTGVLDGNSLTPLFQHDDPTLTDRPLFWHLASQWKHGTCSAIMLRQYKLIQFLKDGAIELYDLDRDHAESHDLVTEQPEFAQQLLDQLEAWRKANHVPLPPNSPLPF